MNQEIREQNMKYKAVKEDQEKKIKEWDKNKAREIIEKERILDQLDQEKKDKYKKETREFLLNFKNRGDEAKQGQEHLDTLLKVEMEKQWNKRQDHWDKEQDARVKLLHEVYADRERALRYNKNIRTREVDEKDLEKVQVCNAVETFEEEEKRKELEELMRLRQHQNLILWQVNEKQETRRQALLEDMEAERARRLNEINYQRRIGEEQELGRRLVEEARVRNAYDN